MSSNAALSPAGKAAAEAVAGAPCGTGTRSFAARPQTAASLHAYDDFIEDAGGAPDYCAANFVTNDNETITIGAHIHNRSGFASGDVYGLFLDTDRNALTGGTGGADYVILLSDGSARVGRWNGSGFEPMACRRCASSGSKASAPSCKSLEVTSATRAASTSSSPRCAPARATPHPTAARGPTSSRP